VGACGFERCATNGDDWAADQLVVQARGGVSTQSGASVCQTRRKIIDTIPAVHTYVIGVPADSSIPFAALARAPHSIGQQKFCAPLANDGNDYWYPGEWYLATIQAPLAWDFTIGNPNVVIAIVDSGVSPVADLAPKLIPGINLIDSTDTSDGLNHGTPAAGIAAAASNNTTGVAGVSWLSSILPVKIYNSSASRHVRRWTTE